MKRAASALPNAGKADKPRMVEVIHTTYKPSCIRQSLGSSVKLAWKKAVQTDTERIEPSSGSDLGPFSTILLPTSRQATPRSRVTTTVSTASSERASPFTAMIPKSLPLGGRLRSSNGVTCGNEAEAAFRRDGGQSSG